MDDLEKLAEEINDELRALRHTRGAKIQDSVNIIAKVLMAEREQTARRCAELLNSAESQMRKQQEPESNGFGAALIWAENRIKKEYSL